MQAAVLLPHCAGHAQLSSVKQNLRPHLPPYFELGLAGAGGCAGQCNPVGPAQRRPAGDGQRGREDLAALCHARGLRWGPVSHQGRQDRRRRSPVGQGKLEGAVQCSAVQWC